MEKLQSLIGVYKTHCTIREVDEETGDISSPALLSEKTLKEIFKFLNKEDFGPDYQFKGFIPENVLSFNQSNGTVIWYTEPDQKYLYFQENLEIKDGLYPTPYLLWMYKDSSLFIYSLLDKPKSKNDKLFRAPYLNIFSKGNVCMGNVKINKNRVYFDDIINDVQNGFWNSKFTHTNVDELVVGSIFDFYKKHLKKKKFPVELLVSIEKRIKDIL